jgi:signal transduction histidine kinase
MRIARQIHDELGQALTAIKMDFVFLIARLPDNGKQFQERTNSILKLTDDTIQNVRRIAAELRPGILDDLGLAAAIEWQAQEFQARAGIQCLVDLPEDGISLDSDRSTAIFRIFQETLTNVVRHAQATRVDVRIEQAGIELILEVRDDGKGIEERKIQDIRSLGLLGMKERALILGGTLEVRGRKGKGTTLRVRVPVERRKTARPDQGNVQDPHR